MDGVDCVVVGAGVVGLAVARALALSGREVLVLEAAETIGSGISARNSEVIHAGLYYPRDSLKAQLCVQGRRLLYEYCAARGVAHRRSGKLVVATDEAQLAQLAAVQAAALANGVDDLRWLSRDDAQALEPALACVAAVLSPSTGIVDAHGLMLALQGDLEHAGGLVVLRSPVEQLRCSGADGIVLQLHDGNTLRARSVVNAAGLQAPALARRTEGLAPRHVPGTWWAKGSYFALSGRSPFTRLVYPVPEPGGLGVHLTLDLAGQARFGPDVQWVDTPDDYTVEPARGDSFYAAVRRYWPALRDGALQPAYAGIRPKIAPPGAPAPDFVVQGPCEHGVAGLVNLFGIESPGLTSALALAALVAQQLAA